MVYSSSFILLFHGSDEKLLDSAVEQRKYVSVKYYALPITEPSITNA
jgi:hypothetical protein